MIECSEQILDKILAFFETIGLNCQQGDVPEKTFLPGISINNGVLVFDKNKLLYLGDLLHEAGHLAVITPEKRNSTHHDAGKKAAEEMMAIAWSYAALVHLDLDAGLVFHEDGYRGGSASLIENFTNGHYIALPMLQWLGMAVDAKTAKEKGIEAYPAMIKWML